MVQNAEDHVEVTTKVITIMFADIVGSTERSEELERGEDLRIKEQVRKHVETHLSEFEGEIVKPLGDGFMISFNSPTNAVLCGKKIQDQLEHKVETDEIPEVQLRIGIHTGEVSVNEEGDFFGREVNVAARIEAAAEPGEVYFSETTFGAMNTSEVNFEYIGAKSVKGIKEKVGMNRVIEEGKIPLHIMYRRMLKWGGAIIVALLLFSGGYYYATLPNVFNGVDGLQHYIGEKVKVIHGVSDLAKAGSAFYINTPSQNMGRYNKFYAVIFDDYWGNFSPQILNVASKEIKLEGQLKTYTSGRYDSIQIQLSRPSSISLVPFDQIPEVASSKVGDKIGDEIIVKAKVFNVKTYENKVVLVFQTGPAQFLAEVSGKDLMKFEDINFKNLVGKKVAVIGVVDFEGMPFINLYYRYQLQILRQNNTIDYEKIKKKRKIVFRPQPGKDTLRDVWAESNSQSNINNSNYKNNETKNEEENKLKRELNINEANLAQLAKLNGLGTTFASEIIDYRKENGKFDNWAELENVKYLGPERVRNLRKKNKNLILGELNN